jgi:hypothetical protein
MSPWRALAECCGFWPKRARRAEPVLPLGRPAYVVARPLRSLRLFPGARLIVRGLSLHSPKRYRKVERGHRQGSIAKELVGAYQRSWPGLDHSRHGSVGRCGWWRVHSRSRVGFWSIQPCPATCGNRNCCRHSYRNCNRYSYRSLLGSKFPADPSHISSHSLERLDTWLIYG